MRVNFRLNKLYIVQWLDAAGHMMEDLPNAKPSACLTVGWAKSLEKDYVVLASSLYKDSEHGDFTVLPLGMIQKVTLVKEGKNATTSPRSTSP